MSPINPHSQSSDSIFTRTFHWFGNIINASRASVTQTAVESILANDLFIPTLPIGVSTIFVLLQESIHSKTSKQKITLQNQSNFFPKIINVVPVQSI